MGDISMHDHFLDFVMIFLTHDLMHLQERFSRAEHDSSLHF